MASPLRTLVRLILPRLLILVGIEVNCSDPRVLYQNPPKGMLPVLLYVFLYTGKFLGLNKTDDLTFSRQADRHK